ncbi:MAG: DEAD/DEAH box helicase [Chloroflexi bacterium]|nr:DEAD/DEAH box helicase [Chloroflexota bacterium]
MGNIDTVLSWLRQTSPEGCLAAWETLPPTPACYGTWPTTLDYRLLAALQDRGIEHPYSHQAEALARVVRGENIVVVTPTASGKSLCYNVPVIQRLLEKPQARALYLFPTKALAQDQLAELRGLCAPIKPEIRAFTFDGDTSAAARSAVRRSGHIVITNPDMLHASILPHHTSWIKLFESLEFVIVDELHTYRGVFGSHVSHVLRRLQRICEFYGSRPQFICSSATIANPQEHAHQLIGQRVSLVDNDGSPRGAKHFVIYNPPLVSADLGIRRSTFHEAIRLAEAFLRADIQTILFARSRLSVELLLTYLRRSLKLAPDEVSGPVRGYRGGYLPSQRREIEAGLRSGDVRAVVSTNALELGIDIGRLQAAVLVGYPGSITSTWQQAGRAGRGREASAVILIANSTALDQFIATHPSYLFSGTAEGATINPMNDLILNAHVKCSAFELPFADGETLQSIKVEQTLEGLASAYVLHHADGVWHWASEKFPAADVNLRSADVDNVVIVDETHQASVIGEMDYLSSLTMLHEGAIYLHEGRQFHVNRYDAAEHRAYVHQVDVDYYTDAELDVDLQVMDISESRSQGATVRSLGEIAITIRPSIYKKIRLETHENVGWGPIHLPAFDMHTSATWLALPAHIRTEFPSNDVSSALSGLASMLPQLAPVFALCDPRDVRAHVELRSRIGQAPTLYLYDAVPSGIGLAACLHAHWDEILVAVRDIIRRCPCSAGCPACVGPSTSYDRRKASALRITERILEERLAGPILSE